MPDTRECTFCHLPNPLSAQRCGGCGAPMAGAALPSLLVEVPPAPRKTNWKLLWSDGGSSFMLLWGALFGGIGGGLGALFMVIGTLTLLLPMAAIGFFVFLVFGGIGGGVFGLGFYRSRARNQIWKHGVAIEGSVLSVEENFSVRINGRHPWIVRYRFRWPDGDKEAEMSLLDPRLRNVQEGTLLRVLVDPQDPLQSLVYLG